MKVTSSRMETCFASRLFIIYLYNMTFGMGPWVFFLDPVLHMVNEFDGISKWATRWGLNNSQLMKVAMVPVSGKHDVNILSFLSYQSNRVQRINAWRTTKTHPETDIMETWHVVYFVTFLEKLQQNIKPSFFCTTIDPDRPNDVWHGQKKTYGDQWMPCFGVKDSISMTG